MSDMNTGNFNSGYRNSGHFNSGDYNSGNRNSGHYNSGDCNSGHYNSGDCNSGHFNTDEPDKIRIFNTWVDMTPSEFYAKYDIAISPPLNTWDDGGYLKTLDYKEAWAKWWEEHPDDHQKFLDLPHFDADVFKEITGIDVEKKCHPDTITVDGVKYRREA